MKLLKVMVLVNMNNKDIKLIIILVIGSLIGLILINIFKDNGLKEALVYYKSDLVLKIDMNQIITKKYTVVGTNGDVIIEYSNGKLRVIEEKSPRHLCSKQGWISESYESIVCLPNEIVINIKGVNKIDTIVK